MNNFSFNRYQMIIETFKRTGRLSTFSEVVDKKPKEFIVIRHDIEFCLKHAYDLAKLERACQVRSLYLVQIRNGIYNALEKSNLNYLQQIKQLGHEVGLHYYYDREARFDIDGIKKQISSDAKILSIALGEQIKFFSIHRPDEQILASYIKLANLVNCYCKQFFSFRKKSLKVNHLELPVVYISDSNNLWRYGEPIESVKKLKKIRLQALFHPYTWNQKHLASKQNLKRIFKSKLLGLDKQFSYELKNYPKLPIGSIL